jgi:hypothetical protein
MIPGLIGLILAWVVRKVGKMVNIGEMLWQTVVVIFFILILVVVVWVVLGSGSEWIVSNIFGQ